MLPSKLSIDEKCATFAELALSKKFITPRQVELALLRQKELEAGGIRFSFTQTLLEQRFLTLEQLKFLNKQLVHNGQKRPSSIRTLGDYDILEVLSSKGICQVFKAFDRKRGGPVVLKVFPRELISDSSSYERFLREINVACSLSHPNIVTSLAIEVIARNPLLKMEYVESISLQERLEREGNIAEMEAWQIACEIAKGLSYAAQRGIIHRDIKPDNILCLADGRIKILDMGCAKTMNGVNGLTLPGTTIGTPFYMSPEQATGRTDIDARSDIYSLGCTVYHMLTGSVPFLSQQCHEVMHQHVVAPRPDPREILPEISEDSAWLLKSMMAVQRNQRPSSAAVLIQEINKLITRLPLHEAIVRPLRPFAPSSYEAPVMRSGNSRRKQQSGYRLVIDALKRLFA